MFKKSFVDTIKEGKEKTFWGTLCAALCCLFCCCPISC